MLEFDNIGGRTKFGSNGLHMPISSKQPPKHVESNFASRNRRLSTTAQSVSQNIRGVATYILIVVAKSTNSRYINESVTLSKLIHFRIQWTRSSAS